MGKNALCIHGQELETCTFGCTLRKAEDLRLALDKLKAENRKLQTGLRGAQQELDAHGWRNKCQLKVKQ